MKKTTPVSIQRIFALVSLLLALAACGESPQQKAGGKPSRPQAKPTSVEVAQPEIGLAADYYVTTATLEPSSDAEIFARTSGVVRKLFTEEGQDVKAGDILLQLEDDDQQLRLKQAEQKLESAEREFARLKKMRNAGAVSPTEFEAARTTFETAETDVELAKLALSYTKISAPFDGRVVWREVDLGAHVLNGNLLFRIMAIDPLLIRVHVPASRVGNVEKGQTVALKVDSLSQSLAGVVDLVSPIVDPNTGTVKVTILLDAHANKVRPGDFTEVRLVTAQRANAMLLPSIAIIEERGDHFIFLEKEDKAVKTPVEVGFIVDQQTEIVSGISTSDNVVVKGQRNLNDGNAIKVLNRTGTDLPSKMSDKKTEEGKVASKSGSNQ